jgi:hypothetical protein
MTSEKLRIICHLAVLQKEERLTLRDISCNITHVDLSIYEENLKIKRAIFKKNTHFELTPQSTVILEKPIDAQLVKICFAFCETRRSITVSMCVHH